MLIVCKFTNIREFMLRIGKQGLTAKWSMKILRKLALRTYATIEQVLKQRVHRPNAGRFCP
jgi:hypothetical protein